MSTAADRRAGAPWVPFASIALMTTGMVMFLEGLIAVVRGGAYFRVPPDRLIILSFTAWGWVMVGWGFVLMAAAAALPTGADWARVLTTAAVTVNVVLELAFLGGADSPLWAATVIALNLILLYAVVIHWRDV